MDITSYFNKIVSSIASEEKEMIKETCICVNNQQDDDIEVISPNSSLEIERETQKQQILPLASIECSTSDSTHTINMDTISNIGTSIISDSNRLSLQIVKNCEKGMLDDNRSHFLRKKCGTSFFEYNDNILVYGFTENSKNNNGICLICGKTIQYQHSSRYYKHFMKHIMNDDLSKVEKYSYEFFKELKNNLENSRSLLMKNTISNDLIIKFSYGVSLAIAKSGLPYTSGERLVFPVLKLWEELYKRNIKPLLLSSNTIKRRISDISNVQEMNIISELNSSNYFALQLDESTDTGRISQLILFVRYLFVEKFKESFLTVIQLSDSKSGFSLFEKVSDYFKKNGIDWKKCTSICFDGASAMNGDHHSFKNEVLKVNPECMFIHCYLHREEICVSVLPYYIKQYFISCTEVINHINQSTIRTEKMLYIQRSLLEENKNVNGNGNNYDEKHSSFENISNMSVISDNDDEQLDYFDNDENEVDPLFLNNNNKYDDLKDEKKKSNSNDNMKNAKAYRLLHFCSTRWLSRFESIKRFNMLKPVIETILSEEKNKDLYEKIVDKKFTATMFYLEDITELFYNVNKKMQGGNSIFLEYIKLIKELYIKLCHKYEFICDNTMSVFPKLNKYCVQNNDLDLDFFRKVIRDHLDALLINIENYYPEVMNLLEFETALMNDPSVFIGKPLIDKQLLPGIIERRKERRKLENYCVKRNEDQSLQKNDCVPPSIEKNTIPIIQEKCYGCIVNDKNVYNITCILCTSDNAIITGKLINPQIESCTYFGDFSGTYFVKKEHENNGSVFDGKIKISFCNSYFYGCILGHVYSQSNNNENNNKDTYKKTQRKIPVNKPITNMYNISNIWVLYPFEMKYVSTVKYDILLYEELLVLSCNNEAKMRYNTLPIDLFYCSLCREYSLIFSRAMSILLPFPTSYLCERGFSEMTYLKSKKNVIFDYYSNIIINKHHSINHENDSNLMLSFCPRILCAFISKICISILLC
ncbi:hypothetical protein WA158_008013 [Blastocystis sp. Blastoise]